MDLSFTVEAFQSSYNMNLCYMFIKNNMKYSLHMQNTVVKVLLALYILKHAFCTVF